MGDSSSRWASGDAEGYDARFEVRARAGVDVHGEASFVESLGASTVLDAGCGTGRVAIELARRGLHVTGVDVDANMLERARSKAPELEWVLADLATLELTTTTGERGALRRFDTVVVAGNVMLFVAAGTEAAVVRRLAAHLLDGGRLVCGYQLRPGELDLATYDAMCTAAGLTLEERYATWDRDPWVDGGDYAVSVHRAGRISPPAG